MLATYLVTPSPTGGEDKNVQIFWDYSIIEEPNIALPDDFNAKDYLDTGFGKMYGGTPVEVKLRITGAQREWVHENRIHPTQKVHTAPNGDVILTMKTPLVPTLVGGFLKAGGDAVVVGPGELKEMVREKARLLAGDQ